MKIYAEGLNMQQFKRIDDISVYNHNYYVGFDKDLLYGISDDDNKTDWYIVNNCTFNYLGESFCSENELLHVYDNPKC
jgi:hypothetical protein